jgi:uncharacterized membrane protein
MRLKNLDLIVAVIMAVMNVVWALTCSINRHSTTSALGIILALPLVFVLPGYTLTEAMFHKRALAASHRLMLSLGLSLAIDILGGLVLNLLPIGLQATSWAVLLGLLTAVFALLAAMLRRGARVYRAQPLKFPVSIYACFLLGLATIVAVLAVQYSAINLAQQPHPGFTQLWMLPSVRSGKSCAVRLGVRSFESTSVTYRIVLTVNKVQVMTWPSVVLAPQEQWDQSVPIASGTTGSVYVEVRLYKLDKPEIVYREVHVTCKG